MSLLFILKLGCQHKKFNSYLFWGWRFENSILRFFKNYNKKNSILKILDYFKNKTSTCLKVVYLSKFTSHLHSPTTRLVFYTKQSAKIQYKQKWSFFINDLKKNVNPVNITIPIYISFNSFLILFSIFFCILFWIGQTSKILV